eukprot:CAMPEP_0196820998 /NCGR_PEP_ID=MMETSP1362-20130617/77399_1 /TAXON_ID=163516 /ORGANISM="Leptocylindrus danicus, Strain CCMP1856" /LENGTH=347 /DNA_ID=CAMNT_0042200053 /DNA_START=220 /DNA_END=1264 /DNA_ORIENTATION=-
MNAPTIAALLATSTISFAPSIILVLFPNFDTDSLALSLGKSLAAGGLLGDVFLHTLPHSQGHDDVNVGAWVLVGFCSFLAMDMLVRTVNGNHDHVHDHVHAHKGHSHSRHANNNGTTKSAETTYTASVDKFASSTVLLNLAADSLHNFTDGVAIGTSFAASSPTSVNTSVLSVIRSRGGLASLSVLCHEIPHELGDFSVLVSEGFTKWQAIAMQGITAIAAFLGTLFGLAAFHLDGLGHVLMPFTSGGFVYLAAVSILPEILEEKGCAKRKAANFFAFLMGIAFLQAVAILEHSEADAVMIMGTVMDTAMDMDMDMTMMIMNIIIIIMIIIMNMNMGMVMMIMLSCS